MKNLNIPFITRLVLIFFLSSTLLAACNSTAPEPSPPSPVSSAAGSTATETQQPTETLTQPPSATSPPSRVVLVVPPAADPAQSDALQSALAELSAAESLEFEVQPALAPGNLTPALRLVVVLAPDPGLVSLAGAAPDVQFLGIGIPGLAPATNLSLIGSQGMSPDQQGFLAGYLAAVVTPEWRTAVMSIGDTPSGMAARQGFLNGVVFFCGLCRQTYPPFYTYPMYVELPGGASPAEWQAAADVLKDKFVQTVYLAPGAGDETLMTSLAEAGLQLIGSQTPPAAMQAAWIASVGPDYITPLQTIWPDLMKGEGGADLPAGLAVSDINPELLSPGRQRLVEELIQELQSGFIDTGVAP